MGTLQLFLFATVGIVIAIVLGCDVTRIEDVTNPHRVSPSFKIDYEAGDQPNSFVVKLTRKGYGKRAFQIQKATIQDLPSLGGNEIEFKALGEMSSDSEAYVDSDVMAGQTYRYQFYEASSNSFLAPIDISVPFDLVVSQNRNFPDFALNIPPSRQDFGFTGKGPRYHVHRLTLKKNTRIAFDTRWRELFIDKLIAESGAQIQIGQENTGRFAEGLTCSGLTMIVQEAEGEVDLLNLPAPCTKYSLMEDFLTFPWNVSGGLFSGQNSLRDHVKNSGMADAEGFLFIVEKSSNFLIQSHLRNTPAHFCVKKNGQKVHWDKECDSEETFSRSEDHFRKVQRPGAVQG